jgi:hypothetical protein
MSNLSKTSIDKHDGKNGEPMTDSPIKAVNFDNVKKEYIKNLRLCDTPKSNDALHIKENGDLIFIEFKNGVIDSKEQYSIRKKIYDSILILTDIVGIGISEMRKIADYILVINEKANPSEATEMKSYVQPSPSFDKIAQAVSKKGNGKYIPYGVKIFENYCFRNVDVFTKSDFEKYLQENLI